MGQETSDALQANTFSVTILIDGLEKGTYPVSMSWTDMVNCLTADAINYSIDLGASKTKTLNYRLRFNGGKYDDSTSDPLSIQITANKCLKVRIIYTGPPAAELTVFTRHKNIGGNGIPNAAIYLFKTFDDYLNLNKYTHTDPIFYPTGKDQWTTDIDAKAVIHNLPKGSWVLAAIAYVGGTDVFGDTTINYLGIRQTSIIVLGD